MNDTNKTILCKLSDKLVNLWRSSHSYSIFYHDSGEKAENSLIVNVIKKIPIEKYLFKPIKAFFSKAIDNSFILGKILSFFEYLLSVSVRCYGWCFVIFVAISLLFNVLNHTFSEDIAVKSAIAVFSFIPTLFVSKSISSSICENRIFSFIFLDLLDCERLLLFSKNKSKGSISGAIIAGFIASFFSLAYTRTEILIFVLLLFLTFIFLCRPETAMLFLSLTFAVLPFKISVYLFSVALLSHLIKVIRGKRSLYISLYDFPPICFLILYIFLNSKENISIVALLMPLVYFFFSGMSRNENLMVKCINNIVISISILASYNLILYVIKEYFLTFSELFENIVGNKIPFSNNGSISVFYACSFALLLALGFYKKQKKRFVFLGIVLNILSIYFSGNYNLFYACIFSALFLFLNYYRNKIVVIFSSVAIIAISLKFIPFLSNAQSKVDTASILSTKYFKYIFSGTNKSELIYNSENVIDAGNLWLQLAFWGGILTSIFVLFCTLIFVRNGLSQHKPSLMKTNSLSKIISCAVISFFVASFMCFTWNDHRLYALFWILGGLSSSSRRIFQNETTVYLLEEQEKIYQS